VTFDKPSFACHLERSRSNATAQSRDPGAASRDDAETRSSAETAHLIRTTESAEETPEPVFISLKIPAMF
jgi:hypothetical protein